MKILASSKKITFGFFENTEHDFKLFDHEIRYFESGLNIHDHPLSFHYGRHLFSYPEKPKHYFKRHVFPKDLTIRVFKNAKKPYWIGNIALERGHIKGDRYENPSSARINYAIIQRWRRNGYGQESMRLLAKIAYKLLGINQLVAGVKPGNDASLKVFKNAGYEYLGLCKRRRSYWIGKDDHHFEYNTELRNDKKRP